MEAEIGEVLGLQKERGEKEASQGGHWKVKYMDAREQPLALTTRRPLVIPVGVEVTEARPRCARKGWGSKARGRRATKRVQKVWRKGE